MSAPLRSAQRPIRSKVGTAVMTFLPEPPERPPRDAGCRWITPDHDLFRRHAMYRRKSIAQVRPLDVRKTVCEVCGALLNRRDRARRRTVRRFVAVQTDRSIPARALQPLDSPGRSAVEKRGYRCRHSRRGADLLQKMPSCDTHTFITPSA